MRTVPNTSDTALSIDHTVCRQTGTHQTFKVGKLACTELSQSADWHMANRHAEKVGRLAHGKLVCSKLGCSQ